MNRQSWFVLIVITLFAQPVWAQSLDDDVELGLYNGDTVAMADENMSAEGGAYERARQRGEARGFGGSAEPIGEIVWNVSAFGGVIDTIDPGVEESYTVGFGGVLASVRLHALDFEIADTDFRLELGGGGKIELGAYSGSSYESFYQQYTLFPELVFREDSKVSRGSLMLRPLITYMKNAGESDGDYEASHYVLFSGLETLLELRWPFGVGRKRFQVVSGRPVYMVDGWLPRIDLWVQWKKAIKRTKHSSETVKGNRDESDVDELLAKLHVGVHKWAFLGDPTVEAIVGGVGILEARDVDGSNKFEDGTTRLTFGAGVRGTFVFDGWAGAYLECSIRGKEGGVEEAVFEAGFNFWGVTRYD